LLWPGRQVLLALKQHLSHNPTSGKRGEEKRGKKKKKRRDCCLRASRTWLEPGQSKKKQRSFWLHRKEHQLTGKRFLSSQAHVPQKSLAYSTPSWATAKTFHPVCGQAKEVAESSLYWWIHATWRQGLLFASINFNHCIAQLGCRPTKRTSGAYFSKITSAH